MSNQRISRETFHYKWDRNHKPVASIRSGDTVTFEINEVTSWQITRATKSDDLNRLDDSKLYPLAGPVYVEDAKPGDTLVVHVDKVKTGRFGWSAIIPGLGLLEEFNQPFLHKWDLTADKFTRFNRGIKIPMRPFCGVMGVAPPEAGSFDVMPPGKHGGNMDIKHLTAGATLELPVWVDGALFSAGDVHAAMGDGEVCVSAVECDGVATLSFELKKETGLEWPRYSANAEPPPRKGYYVATGIAPDLAEATKGSVRNMIDYLTDSRGLSREEAYVLCSVAADLRIHEIVDRPNWVVGAMIPLDIFTR